MRLPTGSSDPVSFTCTCPASAVPNGGLVLLFYRYFAAPQAIPSHKIDVARLSAFHTEATARLNLGGKIRVAQEGFNVTVGGTRDEIWQYMKECISHWSFQGLKLGTEDEQNTFFKPTTGGCACAFGGSPASVQIKSEITPMGVANYLPKDWDIIETLEPADFHARCWEEKNKVILDVRNHYESRIGFFVDPVTGAKAVTPEIRRFSQWPQYVTAHLSEIDGNGKERQIMTYCTGGIRCEKGVRWMAEKMEKRPGDRICTLKGGIAAYMVWMDEEIKQGRKSPDDSLFKGKNYVFDSRGSTGLNEGEETDPVSFCHMCQRPSDRLSKCHSRGCHLVLVVCLACEETLDPRCCPNCAELDVDFALDEKVTKSCPRPICACERSREQQLWTASRTKQQQNQAQQKTRLAKRSRDINISIKTFD